MPAGPPAPPAPDPIEPDAPGALEASRGGCGARGLEVALAGSGITASRRRTCRISREDGLSGAYSGRGPGPPRPAAPPDAADAPLTALGIERSASRPGDPRDGAVAESTSRILKRELVAGRRLGSEEGLRAALLDWADWYDNLRIHSTLGYMSRAPSSPGRRA